MKGLSSHSEKDEQGWNAASKTIINYLMFMATARTDAAVVAATWSTVISKMEIDSKTNLVLVIATTSRMLYPIMLHCWSSFGLSAIDSKDASVFIE